jgi:hypothetical protein
MRRDNVLGDVYGIREGTALLRHPLAITILMLVDKKNITTTQDRPDRLYLLRTDVFCFGALACDSIVGIDEHKEALAIPACAQDVQDLREVFKPLSMR